MLFWFLVQQYDLVFPFSGNFQAFLSSASVLKVEFSFAYGSTFGLYAVLLSFSAGSWMGVFLPFLGSFAVVKYCTLTTPSQSKYIVFYTCLTGYLYPFNTSLSSVSSTPHPPFYSASKFGCFRFLTQLASVSVGFHLWIQPNLDWKYLEGKNARVPKSELRFAVYRLY